MCHWVASVSQDCRRSHRRYATQFLLRRASASDNCRFATSSALDHGALPSQLRHSSSQGKRMHKHRQTTMKAASVLLTLIGAAAHGQDKPVPCADDPIFKQQDFTVGHWDVYANGKKTAEVRMEKVLKDCAI